MGDFKTYTLDGRAPGASVPTGPSSSIGRLKDRWYRFEQVLASSWQGSQATMALLLHKIMTDRCGFEIRDSNAQCSINANHYEFAYSRSGCAHDFIMSLYFRQGRVVVQCRELGNDRNVRQLGLSVEKYLEGAEGVPVVENLLQRTDEPPVTHLIEWMETEITQPLMARCFIGKYYSQHYCQYCGLKYLF
jgi:hypothetical protein